MDSMGQQLKVARERKKISLSQAALSTHIKIQHLEAIERDDFSRMPAPAYAKGFLRLYATFLGLDPAPFVQAYVDRHGNGRARPELPKEASLLQQAPADPEPAAPKRPPRRSTNPSPWATWLPALKQALLGGAWLRPAGAVAGLVLGVMALSWGISRCTRTPEEAPRAHEQPTVVENPRPLHRSPLAVMKDPPEPYMEIPPSAGALP